MALIIEGERPKGNCWWHDDNGNEHECIFFPCHAYETIGSDNMTHCPIVGEIPDKHGRFVDVDTVIRQLRKYGDAPIKRNNFEIADLLESIAETDTVLEASE